MNCSEFDDWDGKSPDDKLAALDHYINGRLYEEGYLPVNVEVADLDNAWAETDWDGTTITIDRDSLDRGELRDLVDTAAHEFEHVRQGQDGYMYGEEHMYEDDAWDEGFASMLEFEEECQPDPESGVGDEDDFTAWF